MFEAAQLAQGSITSQQIALATARLRRDARDPKVGEAIRRQQDAGAALAELDAQRDALPRAARARPARRRAMPPADLDQRSREARAQLADADAALQAAAPQYGQLVQEVVPAAEVLAALRPGEAFAAITLARTAAGCSCCATARSSRRRLDAGAAAIAALVKRIRASIEPATAAPAALRHRATPRSSTPTRWAAWQRSCEA